MKTLFRHKNPNTGNKNGTQSHNAKRAREAYPVIADMRGLPTDAHVVASTSPAGLMIRALDGVDGYGGMTGPVAVLQEIPPQGPVSRQTPPRVIVYIAQAERLHEASKEAASIGWADLRDMCGGNHPIYSIDILNAEKG